MKVPRPLSQISLLSSLLASAPLLSAKDESDVIASDTISSSPITTDSVDDGFVIPPPPSVVIVEYEEGKEDESSVVQFVDAGEILDGNNNEIQRISSTNGKDVDDSIRETATRTINDTQQRKKRRRRRRKKKVERNMERMVEHMNTSFEDTIDDNASFAVHDDSLSTIPTLLSTMTTIITSIPNLPNGYLIKDEEVKRGEEWLAQKEVYYEYEVVGDDDRQWDIVGVTGATRVDTTYIPLVVNGSGGQEEPPKESGTGMAGTTHGANSDEKEEKGLHGENASDHDEEEVNKLADSDSNSSKSEERKHDPNEQEDLHKTVIDYANKNSGALILEKSQSLKGSSNLLISDKDRYAMAPCSETNKFVTIGLSEDIRIERIKISNYERYSSHIRDFQVLGSQTFNPGMQWVDLGVYRAQPGLGEQVFDLEKPAWARYLRFRFVSHYGVEHYCTVSQIKVHGSTMLQGFREEWTDDDDEEEEEEHDENKSHSDDSQNSGDTAQVGEPTKSSLSTPAENLTHDSVQNDPPRESPALNSSKVSKDSKQDNSHDQKPSAPSEERQKGVGSDNNSLDSSYHIEDHRTQTPERGNVEIATTDHFQSNEQKLDLDGCDVEQQDRNVVNAKEEKEIYTDISSTGSDPTQNKFDDNEEHDETFSLPKTGDDTKEIPESKSEQVSTPGTKESTLIQNYKDAAPLIDQAMSLSTALKNYASGASSAIKTLKDASTLIYTVKEIQNVILSKVSKGVDSAVEENEDVVKGDVENVVQTDSSTLEVQRTNDDDSPLDDFSGETLGSQSENVVNTDQQEQEKEKNTNSHMQAHVDESGKKSVDSATNKLNTEPYTKEDIPVPEESGEAHQTSRNTKKTTQETEPNPVSSSSDTISNHSNLITTLLQKFPNSKCLQDINNVQNFKNKTPSGRSKSSSTSSTSSSTSMEPIFKTLTDQIKSLQANQAAYDLHVKAVEACYRSIIFDLVLELEVVEERHGKRLELIEEALWEMRSSSRGNAVDLNVFLGYLWGWGCRLAVVLWSVLVTIFNIICLLWKSDTLQSFMNGLVDIIAKVMKEIQRDGNVSSQVIFGLVVMKFFWFLRRKGRQNDKPSSEKQRTDRSEHQSKAEGQSCKGTGTAAGSITCVRILAGTGSFSGAEQLEPE